MADSDQPTEDVQVECQYDDLNDNSDSDHSQNSPKKRRKVVYDQLFKAEWKKELSWVEASKKGTKFVWCTSCNCDIKITHGKGDLSKHSKTQKHLKSQLSVSATQKRLPSFFKENIKTQNLEYKAKESVIKISGFIAEHNLPIKIMDHFPDLLRSVCPDSDIVKKINCGRTKMTCILKSVTGREEKMILTNLMKNNKFSIIIDESTDRTCVKHLCLVARMNINYEICDKFLALIPVKEATAAKLTESIIDFFKNNGIPFEQNLIGFGSDGANNMMGAHNSVMSRLKEAVPELFVMKCICHSFHLCASYSCEKLPQEIEQLTREVYNYFANSPLRLETYKEFQEFAHVSPHKILHPSQTRWLSVINVVKRLLAQYDALVLFFTDQAYHNNVQAATILEKLQKPENKLYLQFLSFILPVFTDLNLFMQSQTPKIHVLYKEVYKTVKYLMDCYIKDDLLKKNDITAIDFKNPRNFMDIDEMYFGAEIGASKIHAATLKTVKLKCLEFYIESVKQILFRFPLNDSVFKDFDFIDPEVVVSKKIKSISAVTGKFRHLIPNEDIQKIDSEWRQLKNENVECFNNKNSELFWKDVKKVKLGNGNSKYESLVNFVFTILTLPHSSAAVERIFSQINLNKTKTRNRLSTETLEALLFTKSFVKNNGNNCFNFQVTKSLVNKLNNSIYPSPSTPSTSTSNNVNSDSE